MWTDEQSSNFPPLSHCRLGQVENAVRHVFLVPQQPDAAELQKLQTVEQHLAKSADARRIGDWKGALRETDAAIAAGADSAPLVRSFSLIALVIRRLQVAEVGCFVAHCVEGGVTAQTPSP